MSNSLKNEARIGKPEPGGRKKLPRWPAYLLGASLLAGAALYTHKLVNRPEKIEKEAVQNVQKPEKSAGRVFTSPNIKVTVRKDEITLERVKTGEARSAKILKKIDLGSVLIFATDKPAELIEIALGTMGKTLSKTALWTISFGANDDTNRYTSFILLNNPEFVAIDAYEEGFMFIDGSKISDAEMNRISGIMLDGTLDEKENLLDELSNERILIKDAYKIMSIDRFVTKEDLIGLDLLTIALYSKIRSTYTVESANEEEVLTAMTHELTHALLKTFWKEHFKDSGKPSPSELYHEYSAYMSQFLYTDPKIALLRILLGTRYSWSTDMPSNEYAIALRLIPEDLMRKLDIEMYPALLEVSDDEFREAAKELLDEKAMLVFGKNFDEIADPSFYKKAITAFK